jgi:deoxyribonuclease V
MLENLAHNWNLSPAEAIELQKKLRSQIQLTPLQKPIKLIGGTDLSYNKFSDVIYSGIVLLDAQTMQTVGHSLVIDTMTFPYIPGLLSFREIPSLMKAWAQLPQKPDIMLVDGHGIAHSRRMGIAAHLGLLTQTPTIGCAKNLLFGKYAEPALEKGSYAPILDKTETIGFALRTKDRTNVMYVSPGNLVALEQTVELVMRCTCGYRLPEPTRQAHGTVNALRRGELQAGSWWGKANTLF